VLPVKADISSLSLADAIRLVIHSTERGITAKEIRGKLDDLGYDLSKHENPLASIHTAAKRMIDTEELIWVDDHNKKLSAGPELKPVPEAGPSIDVLESLGLRAKQD
jgi:hypothetical protein